MNYFKVNSQFQVIAVSSEFPEECRHGGAECWQKYNAQGGWTSRNDFDSFEVAERIAESASNLTGEQYIATDSGSGCFPRYDVVELPKVGDPCSYAFNGDSYPCGHVASISKTLKKITTTEGGVFYRRRLSGSWLRNGTWSLVKGHVEQRNPHL